MVQSDRPALNNGVEGNRNKRLSLPRKNTLPDVVERPPEDAHAGDDRQREGGDGKPQVDPQAAEGKVSRVDPNLDWFGVTERLEEWACAHVATHRIASATIPVRAPFDSFMGVCGGFPIVCGDK